MTGYEETTMDHLQPCPACKTSGLEIALDGIVTCSTCRGECVVPIRDERGRFARSEDDTAEADPTQEYVRE